MARLTRSQKKGKKSSYTCRFLKNQVKYSSYPSLQVLNKLLVKKFIKSPGTSAVICVLSLPKSSKNYYYAAPVGLVKGTKFNSEETSSQVKKLNEYRVGDFVCNVQLKNGSSKFLCRSAGTQAKVFNINLQSGYVTLKLKKNSNNNRLLKFKGTNLAMAGRISGGEKKQKPILKAGIASKINRAKGKKYPHVSSNKMNVQEHKLGGSYRKSRGVPMTIRRDTPPGAKFGSIAARRTGRKSRK